MMPPCLQATHDLPFASEASDGGVWALICLTIMAPFHFLGNELKRRGRNHGRTGWDLPPGILRSEQNVPYSVHTHVG